MEGEGTGGMEGEGWGSGGRGVQWEGWGRERGRGARVEGEGTGGMEGVYSFSLTFECRYSGPPAHLSVLQ